MKTETQYFLFREGKVIPCGEEEELAIEVTPCETEINAWNIEALQFYGGEGVCRLTVNFFPLETALRIFGELLEAFEKAQGEAEDFATALCNLLCEIENGGASEEISKARSKLEKAARASNESGATLKAVIELFDIFEDIG